MIKRILIAILICLSANCVYADGSNPFVELFRKHFPENTKEQGFEYLNSFVGDSIYFQVSKVPHITNIVKENPDTIWIKNKLSRKPQEGKDYLLSYLFKSVVNGDSFVTPVSAINDKIFRLYSVKKIENSSQYYPFNLVTVGYEITLLNPETSELLLLVADSNLQGEWKMFSKNTNTKINRLLNRHYYQRRGKSEFIDYCLDSGELCLLLSNKEGKVSPVPNAYFELFSNDNRPLDIVLKDNANTPNENWYMRFYTKEEIEREQEQNRIYTINCDLPKDSVEHIIDKNLPFSFILGVIDSQYAYVSQTLKPNLTITDCTALPLNTIVLIGDKLSVRNEDYYKASLHGKPFYIKCSEVKISEPNQLDTLLSKPQTVRDAFFEFSKEMSHLAYLQENLKKLKELDKLQKRGLIVKEAYSYKMNHLTDATGVNFDIINTSNKVIKYITFNFTGYNAVNDPVRYLGKAINTQKGIGPIEPYESANYTFKYVWYSDAVDYIKLRSIIVQYMDGSTKTYTGDALTIVDKDILNATTTKSPLINFLPIYDEEKVKEQSK